MFRARVMAVVALASCAPTPNPASECQRGWSYSCWELADAADANGDADEAARLRAQFCDQVIATRRPAGEVAQTCATHMFGSAAYSSSEQIGNAQRYCAKAKWSPACRFLLDVAISGELAKDPRHAVIVQLLDGYFAECFRDDLRRCRGATRFYAASLPGAAARPALQARALVRLCHQEDQTACDAADELVRTAAVDAQMLAQLHTAEADRLRREAEEREREDELARLEAEQRRAEQRERAVQAERDRQASRQAREQAFEDVRKLNEAIDGSLQDAQRKVDAIVDRDREQREAARARPVTSPVPPVPPSETDRASEAKPSTPSAAQDAENRRELYLHCVATNHDCAYGTSAACKPAQPAVGPFSGGSAINPAISVANLCDGKWSECLKKISAALPSKATIRALQRMAEDLHTRMSGLSTVQRATCPAWDPFVEMEATLWLANAEREPYIAALKQVQLMLLQGDGIHTCVYYGEFADQRAQLARARIDQCATWSRYWPKPDEIERDLSNPPAPSTPRPTNVPLPNRSAPTR